MKSLIHGSAPTFAYSRDGYIRMTFEAFTSLALRKHFSYEEPEILAELIEEGLPALRAGYCEFISELDAAIMSIGWVWYDTQDGQNYRAPGHINSNVMLISQSGYDLGSTKTVELLCAWIFEEPRHLM